MTRNLSRRGLLGLMAAAPVAVVAKADAPHRAEFYNGLCEIGEIAPDYVTIGHNMDHPNTESRYWRLDLENGTVEPVDHPLPEQPSSLADDEGPGAPHSSGAPVPDISPSDARGGGLPERSPESPASRNRVASDSESENPILQYARAC